MVIRIGAGEVGPSVSQLVRDVRSMMEPGTASRLKVSVELICIAYMHVNRKTLIFSVCSRNESPID